MFSPFDYKIPSQRSKPTDTDFYAKEKSAWRPWSIPLLKGTEKPKLDNDNGDNKAVDMAEALKEIDVLRAKAIEQGYKEGLASGNEAGHKEGFDRGATEGFETGRNEGLVVGEKKGFKDGYEAGAIKARDEVAQLAELLSSSARAVNGLNEDVGQALLALATDIAEHVLHSELTAYPEQLLPLVKSVLKDAEQGQQAVTLRLHPDDAALIETHMAEELTHHEWRIKADVSLSAGSVMVESALSHIDATLETRWLRAVNRLGPKSNSNRKNPSSR